MFSSTMKAWREWVERCFVTRPPEFTGGALSNKLSLGAKETQIKLAMPFNQIFSKFETHLPKFSYIFRQDIYVCVCRWRSWPPASVLESRLRHEQVNKIETDKTRQKQRTQLVNGSLRTQLSQPASHWPVTVASPANLTLVTATTERGKENRLVSCETE